MRALETRSTMRRRLIQRPTTDHKSSCRPCDN